MASAAIASSRSLSPVGGLKIEEVIDEEMIGEPASSRSLPSSSRLADKPIEQIHLDSSKQKHASKSANGCPKCLNCLTKAAAIALVVLGWIALIAVGLAFAFLPAIAGALATGLFTASVGKAFITFGAVAVAEIVTVVVGALLAPRR